MDELPEEVVLKILEGITRTTDKNSISLTCKRLHNLDNEQRKSIRFGCGLVPAANEALVSLCNRFHNLQKIEISSQQLDDEGVYNLSVTCPLLTHLTLSYCTFITDYGLTHLISCPHLSALQLISTPKIHGAGILAVVVECKNLTLLHLIHCHNITCMEWLRYLGKLERLEDLCINNCRGIGEGYLVRLGPTWNKLKRLQFEYDPNYHSDRGHMERFNRFAVEYLWEEKSMIPCDSMLDLNLVNSITSPGMGLARVLRNCKNLQKINLDTCGVRDSDIIELARNSSTNLKSFSLRLSLDSYVPIPMNNHIGLTDECLEALAFNCSNLESVRLSFIQEEFRYCHSFTLHGILSLVHKCPMKELALDRVYWFDDVGMKALRSAQFLEMLELSRCQKITDQGLQLVEQFPRLSVLKLSLCSGVTDDGLKPLVGSNKLKLLAVDDCPRISETGLHGKFSCF